MELNFKQEIRRLKRYSLIQDIFLLVMFGAILNISVIVNNDLKMPVYYHYGEARPLVDDTYLPFTDFDDVKYPYFSDIFKIGRLKFSIGDVLMFGGGFLDIILILYNRFINIIEWRHK